MGSTQSGGRLITLPQPSTLRAYCRKSSSSGSKPMRMGALRRKPRACQRSVHMPLQSRLQRSSPVQVHCALAFALSTPCSRPRPHAIYLHVHPRRCPRPRLAFAFALACSHAPPPSPSSSHAPSPSPSPKPSALALRPSHAPPHRPRHRHRIYAWPSHAPFCPHPRIMPRMRPRPGMRPRPRSRPRPLLALALPRPPSPSPSYIGRWRERAGWQPMHHRGHSALVYLVPRTGHYH